MLGDFHCHHDIYVATLRRFALRKWPYDGRYNPCKPLFTMKPKRGARLSQPFVFTVSALALGACGSDPVSISNPPPPDSGADVSSSLPDASLACPPVAGTACVVGALTDCGAVSNASGCNAPGPRFSCNGGYWQSYIVSCNPPPPDASFDTKPVDTSSTGHDAFKDGSGGGD